MIKGKRSEESQFGLPSSQPSSVEAQGVVAEPVATEVKAQVGSPKKEVASRKPGQKRCVVCRKAVSNCECPKGPMTRERYLEVMGSSDSQTEKSQVSEKEKPQKQSVEDMARFLLFGYSQLGSWGSALFCRLPVQKTNDAWAFSDEQIAKILPRSMVCVEKYWESLPAWLAFIAEHSDLFMLGKILIEVTVENIEKVKDMRREKLAFSGEATIPKRKTGANGRESSSISSESVVAS